VSALLPFERKETMAKLGLLERLAAGPVICAERYLFELERRGYLQAGAYVPEVVLDFPEQVENLHRDFLRAGSDVIEAFTYYAHREKLRLIGRESDLEPMNRAALAMAKKVAAEGDALVAGNICNTNVFVVGDAVAGRMGGRGWRRLHCGGDDLMAWRSRDRARGYAADQAADRRHFRAP
jgi:hypothetical protein